MKKAIALLLGAIMMLSSVSCFAVEATHNELHKNVYVEGKVKEYIEDKELVFTLTVGDEIVYVNEGVVNKDGTYKIKFYHTGSLDDAKINVKYADEDVTTSVVNVSATSQIIEADVYVTDKNDKSYDAEIDKTIPKKTYAEKTVNGVTLPYREYTSVYAPETRDGLKAVVNLKNKFAFEDKVTVMVAAYDINNKLLGCKIEKFDVMYGYNGEKQVVETADVVVPEGTVTAKAFCWSSTSDLFAYGKEADGTLPKVDIFCIGDSFCQDYLDRTWYPESGWGTHLIDYFNEEYVTVKNYGKSGGWAQSIMSNTNDPIYQNNIAEGKEPTDGMYGWGYWNKMLNDNDFSEGDYIIVSLGLNDTYLKGPNGMPAVDWYGMGIEEMVKSAQKNKANIILCSPMLRASVEAPTETRALITRTEEIANKYGVTYLNVNDALEAQYAEEFGYVKGETTEAEKEKIVREIYSKYYLDRDALKDKNHEFHLTDEERANHMQSTMKDEHTDGLNSHPNLRGADNMARWIAVLLKDTDSDLRFYVK